MGGDHGPSVTVPAALAALQRDADLRITLVGLKEPVQALLNGAAAPLLSRIQLREASQVVTMDEKPQEALRKKKTRRCVSPSIW